jgi:hypothetical protein
MHIIPHNLLRMSVCELTLVVFTFPQVKNRYHRMRRMKDVVMSS